MRCSASHTAILVFLREASEDARLKGWFSHLGHQNNIKGARLLNKRIVSLARSTGLPTIILQGKQQEGNTFGHRITHALQTVFDEGFERVIVLGNDCLKLTRKQLLQTEIALQEGKSILGPDKNGGVYLIGLHKSQFLPASWIHLPWQSSNLFEQLQQELTSSRKEVCLLHALHDYNKRIRLDRGFVRTLNHTLQFLFNLLWKGNPGPPCYETFSLKNQMRHLSFGLRAPPTVVSG